MRFIPVPQCTPRFEYISKYTVDDDDRRVVVSLLLDDVLDGIIDPTTSFSLRLRESQGGGPPASTASHLTRAKNSDWRLPSAGRNACD